MFQLSYAINEILRRPARSLFAASVIAVALTGLLITSSFVDAMLDARKRALEPLIKAKIDLVITSPGSNVKMESSEDSVINLEGRNLAPGQYFIEDSIDLNALKTMDIAAINQLHNNVYVADLAPALLLTVSRLEGRAPDKIIIPEKSVSPLTKQERRDIDNKISKDQRFIELEKEAFRLRDLILGDKATSKERKQYEAVGQQLTDIEFGYYPERFKRFEDEEVKPVPIKAKQSKFTVAGVDISKPRFGLLRASDISSGRYFLADDANAVILREDFAKAKGLAVGSNFKLRDIDFIIVGFAKPTSGLSSAQVYMPLSQFQNVTEVQAVNMVVLCVEGARNVEKIKYLAAKLLPGARILETSQASAQLVGSMGRAEALVAKYIGIIMLIVALTATAMVGIIVMAALAGRRRDLGTLQAIGWPRRLLASQVAIELILQAFVGICLSIGLTGLILTVLQRLRVKADFTIMTFDKELTGSMLNGNKALQYLIPHFNYAMATKAYLLVLVLALILGYFAAFLYIRKSSISMFVQEGE